MIPAEAVEAAAKALHFSKLTGARWEDAPKWKIADRLSEARKALEAAAPYIMADILEDVANTAETDELSTAREVISDLRRRARDLRPTSRSATNADDS